MKQSLLALSASLLLVCSLVAQQPSPTPRAGASTSADADNTKRNAGDGDKNPTTADNQSNDQADLVIAQKIRQAVVNDGSLSLNAKNVKIIVRDGRVALRGPVDNQQEKQSIAMKAQEIAGKDKVDDQLEVKAHNK